LVSCFDNLVIGSGNLFLADQHQPLFSTEIVENADFPSIPLEPGEDIRDASGRK
jgi:hypothetical protein